MSLKITYTKKVQSTLNLTEYQYNELLQEFLYNSKDCITGWEEVQNKKDHSIISFTCNYQGANQNSEINYIRTKVVPGLEESYQNKIEVFDELDTLGEMIINFTE